jgi:putative ABC transport system substrate-binding protein
MAIDIARRQFISALGAAAVAWPIVAQAQHPTMPVVGFLGIGSPASDASRVNAFRQGLSELGYVEGRNVVFEYRWADDHNDRLPALAIDLVRRQVTLIAAIGLTPAAMAAKAATPTIPIVFVIGGDPVKFGLVASLNRPGGNLTGFSFLVSLLGAKYFQLLNEAVPPPALIGFLVNPVNPNAETDTKEVQEAAQVLGRDLLVVKASSEGEFETAFAMLTQKRVGALFVEADQFFLRWRERLVALAARYTLPTIYPAREFVEVGGLMSYGTNRTEVYNQAGVYAGRILKGEKAADLPIQQATKVELVVNLKTAKTLALTVPESILARADEVIE